MNLTKNQLYSALGSMISSESDLNMLRTNYKAPNHNITATQMAKEMGWKSFHASNSHYGDLAKRIRKHLNLSTDVDLQIEILVDFHKPLDEWHWIMKKELVETLEDLNLVEKYQELQLSEEIISPEEVSPNLTEGKTKEVKVNIYERNPVARKKCIEHYGPTCQLCGFDFGKVYGNAASGFIHVHHIIPLSEIEGEYEIDPINDLIPVCPNCHAVIHQSKPHYSLEEMRAILRGETVEYELNDWMLDAYFREARKQSKYAIEEWGELSISVQDREVMNAFKHLHHFLSHVSIIVKLLQPSLYDDMEGFKELRSKKIFEKFPQLPKLSKQKVKVRNDIEHIDERLDRWAKQSKSHSILMDNISPPSMLGQFDEIDRFLHIDQTDLSSYFAGEKYDLRALLEYVSKVYQIIRE